MTLPLCNLQSNPFAASNIFELLPLSAHNSVIAPDALATISVNHQWREFMIGILIQQLELYLDDASDDDQWQAINQISDMINDWYN